MPEALCQVSIDNRAISCAYPDGTFQSVAWNDLTSVEIVTTDAGPWAADVFWVLEAGESRCVIPQGATGENAALSRLQTLPGFNSEAVIDAMGSTSNQRFVCWRSSGSTDAV